MPIMVTLLVVSLLPISAVGDAPGQDSVDIREWLVPWEASRPRDPYVGPDGIVWFVGQRTDYVASLDPKTGTFKRFELEPGTGPHNLIVDDQGMVWYAGNRNAHIGRLDPTTGDITRYPMPDPAARDPHTLVFDPAGDIWFTVQGGNFVGKLDVQSGTVQLVAVPTPQARPYGIKVDPSGRPWIVLFGTNKIATVDPRSMTLREHVLPRAEARPRRLELTADGAVWYVDYATGFLGRMDPASGNIREWPTPSGRASRPYGTALDHRGRIWFVESGPDPNQFVAFDPARETFFGITAIPSGGGTVRHMYFDRATRAIWFGTDTNYIGRVIVP